MGISLRIYLTVGTNNCQGGTSFSTLSRVTIIYEQQWVTQDWLMCPLCVSSLSCSEIKIWFDWSKGSPIKEFRPKTDFFCPLPPMSNFVRFEDTPLLPPFMDVRSSETSEHVKSANSRFCFRFADFSLINIFYSLLVWCCPHPSPLWLDVFDGWPLIE